MLNCRQITRLVSQSMDTKLSWPKRWAVRLHLLYCVWCRRYAAQLQFLRQAAEAPAVDFEAVASDKLPAEAREQIRRRLHEALRDPPLPPP